jgi:hypothetical protein
LVPATVNSQNPIFFVPPAFPGTGATVSADFNGDGKLDLASGDRTILLGNGDGTFTVGTPFSAASAINPNLIATADFNGDGKADLIVAAPSTNTFSIQLGNGDGTFQAPIVKAVPAPLTFLAVGDLNGDGKPDVLVLTITGPVLTTYLGKGNGTFAAGINSAASASGKLADFNKDGKLDLLTTAGVQLGNGNGTLQAVLPLPSGTLGAKRHRGLQWRREVGRGAFYRGEQHCGRANTSVVR